MTGRHLNLPLVTDMVSPKAAARLNAFNTILALLFGLVLSYSGFHAISDNARTIVPLLGVSLGSIQSVLLISGILTVLSQGVQLLAAVRSGALTLKSLLGIVVTMLAVSVFWLVFRKTAVYENLVFDHLEIFSLVVLFVAFFGFLFLGTAIAAGLAFAGIITLSLQLDFGSLFTTVGENIFSSLDNFGFLALPFFVLAGAIMNQGGIAQRLIDLAMLLGRRIAGNLWQSNILANMLFGCLSGSGIAAATAIGSMIAPAAREKDYDMPFTTAVNAASAPCGMLIPPSGPFILYSLITGGSASIIAMFLAGYLPGMIMGGAVMLVAWLYAKRRGYSVDRSPYRFSEVAIVFWRALPSLSLVVVVIGGILGGVFTAVEGAGVAALYSFLLAVVYRDLTMAKLIRAAGETVVTSGAILFLIACSGLMSWSMTFASIPDTIGTLLMSVSENKYIVLLLINISLLVVGVFMDMTPAMLIFTPIFYPVVTELGIDPVHFGVVLIYNLCMGVVTPPVGTVLFVSCSITGEKITKVVKPLLPIFFLQFAGLLLVTYLPAISLTIPRLFGL